MSTIVYVTKGTVVDLFKSADLIDGMIEAQAEIGQIAWTELRHHMAIGQRPGGEDDQRRVAVFDLDGADGLHVLYVVQWVNEFTNILPDLS